MVEEKKLLIIPSPLDSRDWIGDSIYHSNTTFPKTLDLRNCLQNIRNQGTQGTCAAQSAACMKEWQERKDIDFREYFSPQFIYNLRENSDSEGMYGRDVMRILYKFGACPEKLYEYGKIEHKHNIINNKSIIELSSNHKIKHYAKLNTISSTKKALFQNGPCLICFPVYNEGDKMWIPKHGQEMKGGHAMTVVGYTNDSFIIRNSWGGDWGDKGYCYYPFNEWGCHWELWTTIDDESVKEKHPEEPREPKTPKRRCPLSFW